MLGCSITTSSGSGISVYELYIRIDKNIGTNRIARYPPAAASFALALNRNQLPSDRATIRPNRPRLQAQIQREPPSAPVNSYHCASETVVANELPSTSHGQEIWAAVR